MEADMENTCPPLMASVLPGAMLPIATFVSTPLLKLIDVALKTICCCEFIRMFPSAPTVR
ncbi:hypothetical protein AWB75_00531 [Caballeronia catudaia]|uniref:Uncharacterized protein n=1 Tax=Caballeronia catudaia TaxID=1777136 RepID=A0A157ZCV0_9BURK|nr:hypothetical protein AWB75_00531 [Caballeronia catudaia]